MYPSVVCKLGKPAREEAFPLAGYVGLADVQTSAVGKLSLLKNLFI